MTFCNAEKGSPPPGAGAGAVGGGAAGTFESEPERRWSTVVAGAPPQMLDQISGEIPKQISNLIPNQESMYIQDLLSKKQQKIMLAVNQMFHQLNWS